jgi:hypothetical protein
MSIVKHMFDVYIQHMFTLPLIFIIFWSYMQFQSISLEKEIVWWVISIYLCNYSLCIHSSLLTYTASEMKGRTINTFFNTAVSKFNFFCIINIYIFYWYTHSKKPTKTKGQWATSLTWGTLAHIKLFFEY